MYTGIESQSNYKPSLIISLVPRPTYSMLLNKYAGLGTRLTVTNTVTWLFFIGFLNFGGCVIIILIYLVLSADKLSDSEIHKMQTYHIFLNT